MADVFRRFGPAFRDQHGASLSTARRRAMSAIETCRTAALGGHVERCGDCGHQRIAYNSLPQPQLPEVPGSRTGAVAGGPSGGTARRAVLPRRVHGAGRDRRHRVSEPDRGLRHPVPGRVGDVAHHRRRSGASRRGDRLPGRAAHLGTEPAAPSRICTVLSPAAGSRPTANVGSPAGRASSCRSGCCRGCSGDCSCTIWRRPSPPAN